MSTTSRTESPATLTPVGEQGVSAEEQAVIETVAAQTAARLGPLIDEHLRLVRHVLDNHQQQRQRRG
ncbi:MULTISPECIES: hypothetical protein [Auritidibacter]|uniref:Uncharacterized protein n=1 Tax=Auritidibacter ignavus TaxID=678932 RepID=A0AAJ6DC14_9MICC|nr:MULTISPECIES: hypothetical protein [Auritidibacter]WGH83200.1 hypothetical protein QDX20_07915 [Auritidibacter ignavus]WGH90323.1 hypothetical protein QDX23_09395 [Auritidibacter ignavus]WGH92671.1 hypothetical protein QDX21_10245 [Auritidibacter ignavus]WHS28952.1 hypothetical protein QM395_04270 [Auritidibacter ignavus]WHS35846.1 hypothetical protein QM403_04615 [Auritidibacter ignavus]